MLRISFVCTGNRCRSPYAARALEALAPKWVVVDSAGTLDAPGERSPRELVGVSTARSIDLSEHRSTAIGGARLAEADLVLGMAREHVAVAVVEGGARPERTFLLTEFVRHLEALDTQASGDDRAQAKALIERIHMRRSAENTFVPADDVEDPMGGPPRAYAAMAARIDDLCRRLARGFGWL